MSKILVIDDDVAILEMARAILEEEDYQVITARDGVEGIEQATTQSPDLILCDEMMPHLAGHEVCERLYAQPNTTTIPIILMSAHYHELVPTTANCLVFLRKPWTYTALMTTIEVSMNKSPEPPSAPVADA